MLKQLQRALQPILKNVRVEWGESLQSKVKQSPPVLPPLFEGERLIFYALLDKGVRLDDLKFADLAIKAQTADQDSKDIVFPLKFDEGELILEKDKKTAHRLAAAGLIKHLSSDKELSKQNKDEIVRLGLKYGLASEHTSFVAVNERREAVEGSLVQIDTNAAIMDKITGGDGKDSVAPEGRRNTGGVRDTSSYMLEDFGRALRW